MGPAVRALAAALLLAALLALASGCGGDSGPVLWIYTSIYKEVLDELAPKLQEQFPGVTLKWYKAGSEEVAARVTAELAAGGTQADILMTADIFWYESLAQDGHLMPLPKDVLEAVPERLRDPGGRYVTSRAAAMVLAVNEAALGGPAPKSYADLAKPELKGKVVIGDPLKSGTHFVTLALLSRTLGWDWYRKLRANEAIVEGGNSAVLRRVETGDRPVGLLLLENLLKAQAGKSTAKLVVPEEGAIIIPSPIAVMARSGRKDDALRFCRLMMQKQGQEMMVRGRMYPVLPGVEGPSGAPPFSLMLAKGLCPDPALIRAVSADAEEIKETFVREMFE